MSTQRYISTSFWNDKWIRTLDPSERYLYMYLLTNPQTNISGIYQITIDRIAFDTGYDERTLRPMLERFKKAGKAAFIYDEWIILPSWPKHQKWEIKETIKKGIDSVVKSLPQKVLHEAKLLDYQYPIDTLLIGYKYSPSYLDSDSDLDIDSDIDLKKETPVKQANGVSKQTEEQFDTFYERYPKKVSKTDAKKTFEKLIKQGVTLETILSKLNTYKAQLQANKTEDKYIRNPQRFLNTLDDFESTEKESSKITQTDFVKCSCGGQIIYGQCKNCAKLYDGVGNEIL